LDPGLALVLARFTRPMLSAFLIGLATGASAAVRFLERRRGMNPGSCWRGAGAAGLLSWGRAYAIRPPARVCRGSRANPSPEG
jgi:hypothetical protein